MSDNFNCAIIATLAFSTGIFTMGILMDNANREFGSLQQSIEKSEQICESFDSFPTYIDLDDELVCANGAVVNYKTFELPTENK